MLFRYVCLAIDFVCITACIVDRLASIWKDKPKEVLHLTIPDCCTEFKEYYDDLQVKISKLTILDELLAGEYLLLMPTRV